MRVGHRQLSIPHYPLTRKCKGVLFWLMFELDLCSHFYFPHLYSPQYARVSQFDKSFVMSHAFFTRDNDCMTVSLLTQSIFLFMLWVNSISAKFIAS